MKPRTTGVATGAVGDGQGKFFWSLALLATLFFMWGFCTVLNDIIIPHLKAVFVMGYFEIMLIQFVFFGSYFLLSLPSAVLIERFGYKTSIVIGLSVMGVACLLFVPAAGLGALRPSYPIFLAALFVLAGGITLLQVAANPYVAVLGTAKTSSSRLNLVQAFNSMGTFVAPTFGGLLILARSTSGTAKAGEAVSLAERLQDAKAVQGPYIGIAVVLFLLAVAIFVARLPRISTHSEPGSKGGASVWGHPLLLLGVIAIFVYVGAEVTIGSFMISYISSPHVIGVTTAAAAKYVTFYWGGAMVGRFIGSAVMRKVNPALILGFNSVAAVVALAVSMISGGEVALWSIILVGLCNSIMFPTIFTLAIKGLGPLTGRGSGFLIMAICGGGLLPLAQGTLADMAGVGLTLSFVAPVICYVYLVYFAWKSYQLRSADDGDAVPALVGH